MNPCLALFALLVAFTISCARKPVQQDVVVEGNTMGHTNTAGHIIHNSPGADKAPFELQYIDTTIELDLTAIDAEHLVATRAQHIDLKKFASSTIAERQEEIASLRQLRAGWFGDMPQAINFDLLGSPESIQKIDLEKLDLLKENAFDLEFLREMVPLDEATVTIANDLTGKDSHAELKQQAESIIKNRQTEIEQMKKWENDWSKP
jgi:uncharacterized protein (DUF305 family)